MLIQNFSVPIFDPILFSSDHYRPIPIYFKPFLTNFIAILVLFVSNLSHFNFIFGIYLRNFIQFCVLIYLFCSYFAYHYYKIKIWFFRSN